MKNQIITYSEDMRNIIPEVIEKFPQFIYYDEEEKPHLIADLTPIKNNGYATLAVMKAEPEHIEAISQMDSLEVLGTFDEIFADEDLDTKYKSVYPYDEPISYIDEDGEIQERMRPKKIGGFM